MTRKEWIRGNCPNKLNPTSYGGVEDCPYHYPKLKELDRSIVPGMQCPPGVNQMDRCIKCWNAPLPDVDGARSSDKVKIPKTIGEPHIKDVFYTIVRYPIGQYWLYLVGEFSVVSMTAISDAMVKCVSFDYDFQYEYTFFYDLTKNVVSLTPDIQYQAKSTPDLDRSLFLERRDAIEALEKWTGNVSDKSYYFLKKKGE